MVAGHVWSGLFNADPNDREKRYLFSGRFFETWLYLANDLVVVCWYYEKRDQSLPFITKLGYRTLAGAYYDADDLTNPKAWLESLDRTSGPDGFRFTTWESKYQLLAAFGDFVSKW